LKIALLANVLPEKQRKAGIAPTSARPINRAGKGFGVQQVVVHYIVIVMDTPHKKEERSRKQGIPSSHP
jgi:hypothetical protein